jgi:prepilin-type N-terminal cleavage/methylation domain-containing protein
LKINQQKGYTLAEILVVVAIIVVLGLALLVGINPMAQIFKAYDAHRKADLSKIKIALEAYYSDHDCYPVFPLKDSKNRPSYVCDSNLLVPYLTSMPCDPNTRKPYTLYLTPTGSSCPQQFAVYAQIYAFFDKSANDISYCPNMIDVHSTDMKNLDLVFGCSSRQVCPTIYGCKSGACVVVAEDDVPTCGPNFCDSACSPINVGGKIIDCTTINPDDGTYVRECIAF